MNYFRWNESVTCSLGYAFVSVSLNACANTYLQNCFVGAVVLLLVAIVTIVTVTTAAFCYTVCIFVVRGAFKSHTLEFLGSESLYHTLSSVVTILYVEAHILYSTSKTMIFSF